MTTMQSLSGQLFEICLVICGLCFIFTEAEIQEVCLREKFNVTCPPHHVINVKVARFGRLKTGRCIAKNLGLGCYEVVSDSLSSLCSGRQRCSVDVLTMFARLSPCPEMESYLETEYECLSVTEVTPNQCRAIGLGPPSHPLIYPRGIIASHFIQQVIGLQMKQDLRIPDVSISGKSDDRGNAVSCTIELLANPGMRWNLSLVNFLAPVTSFPSANKNTMFNSLPDGILAGRDSNSKDQRGRGANDMVDNVCRRLFIIREMPEADLKGDKSAFEKETKNHKSSENNNNNDVTATKNGRHFNMAETLVTSCDNWVRERVVYMSERHRLSIEFIFPDHRFQRLSSSSSSSSSFMTEYQHTGAYLLKYQAFGCSDPEVINGSFLRVSHNEVTVTCPQSRELHRLTCVGDQRWEPTGRVICSGVGDMNSWSRFSPDLSTFHGVAFIMVLGVSLGVVVGCSLLAVTVCFYKRRTCRPQSMATTTTTASGHTTYAPYFYQQQQQQQYQDCDKIITYDQQRHLLQHHQQQQQPQIRDNFQADFKSPKNIRRVTNIQTPLLGQTLSQKSINNNNTINTTAASSHPTLLLHQSTPNQPAITNLDITPLLISDSIPPGECFHHHHHHHLLHHGAQVPMSGVQQPRMGCFPGVQFNPDIYGEDSLERALSQYPGSGMAGSKPTTDAPQNVNGDKLQRKILDSFPSQTDHIYEIAG